MREAARELRVTVARCVGKDGLRPDVLRKEAAQPDLPAVARVVRVLHVQASLLRVLRERARLAEIERGGHGARVDQQDEPRSLGGHRRGRRRRRGRSNGGSRPRCRRGGRLFHGRGGCGAGRRRRDRRRRNRLRSRSGRGGRARRGCCAGLLLFPPGDTLNVRPAHVAFDADGPLHRRADDLHGVPVAGLLHQLELRPLFEVEEVEGVARGPAVDRGLGCGHPEPLRRTRGRRAQEQTEDRDDRSAAHAPRQDRAQRSTPTACHAWVTARSAALFAPNSSRAETIVALAASTKPELGTSLSVKAR